MPRRFAVMLPILAATLVASPSGPALSSDDPATSALLASPPASPAIAPGPRQVQLTTTSMMQILDATGQPVTALVVQPGETLEISVSNWARFAHNLVIGTRDALASDQVAGLPGVPAFAGGVRTFTWSVPASVDDLWFGCTVVGHFSVMQGRVVAIVDAMPDVAGLPEADAVALLTASGLLHVERLEAADPTIPAGTLLAQEPAAGSPVDLTTVVRTTVSTGPASAG